MKEYVRRVKQTVEASWVEGEDDEEDDEDEDGEGDGHGEAAEEGGTEAMEVEPRP